MFLTWLMLLVALCLSAIAAFYSIIGLTAIFAAAVMPVIVMGTVLEVAKLTVTVWLHEYWHQCKRSMKLYLVPAVGILMLITSMGIFGFLSKAHLDQAVPAGDISAQVSIFDEKIKTQRDNIESARSALRQLDSAVDQTMARSSDEKGAERAVQLRRQQTNERNRLQNDIARAQQEIVRLNEQRAPIAAQARKVEAEVGPIKYIAALIYGDDPDNNLLEKAVRWVIIILVTVFDPLAIFMLLAATESYKWERARRAGSSIEIPPDQPVVDAMKQWRDRITGLWRKQDANVDDVASAAPDMVGQPARNNLDDQSLSQVVAQPKTDPRVKYEILSDADDEIVVDLDDLDDANDDEFTNDAKRRWKLDNPDTTLKEQRRLVALGKAPYEPWLDYLPKDRDAKFGYGAEWPKDTQRGDIFVKTDIQPTRLYKFTGDKWIEIDKSTSDTYVYEDAYIDLLIGRISQGLYDPELLTDAEREQIELRLKKDLA